MTPGTYLRHIRERAGLSREDLALMTDTTPPVSAHRRAQWLTDVEADAAPVPPGLAEAMIRRELDLDRAKLDELVAAHTGTPVWRAAGSVGAAPAAPLYRYPVLSAEEAERQAASRSTAA